MSRENSAWLNRNTLIGFTAKRGRAWHYRASAQGGESNHYVGAIPVEDVQRRLFNWEAVSAKLFVEVEIPAPAPAESAVHPVFAELNRDLGGDPAFAPFRPTTVTAPRATVRDMRHVEGKQAIVCSDNGHVMGVFSDGYERHQYQDWLVDHVSSILDDDLQIGSAGLLRNRAQAWVSVEVPENIVTPEGVEFRPHLLACTSHDGSIATTYKRVVTNVVCDNTMAAGLAEVGQQLKIKHSKYSRKKLAEARDALAIVYTVADDFAAEVKALCEIDVSARMWREFLNAAVPLPEKNDGKAKKKRSELTRLWHHDSRVSRGREPRGVSCRRSTPTNTTLRR